MAFARILGFLDADDVVTLDNVRQRCAEHKHESLK